MAIDLSSLQFLITPNLLRQALETVPRETSALPLTPPEGTPTTPADVDVLADARAEARSWAPNTRRAYVAGWRDFTSWCLEHRCAGVPGGPADVGRYLEHLVETESRSLATARMRLAAIAAVHRLVLQRRLTRKGL